MFQRAVLIIGFHSNELTNMIYSYPNTTVIKLNPLINIDYNDYYHLRTIYEATALNMNYIIISFSTWNDVYINILINTMNNYIFNNKQCFDESQYIDFIKDQNSFTISVED